MNQKKIRNLHGTLGFFYLGLIVSFSLSGIMMNHREHWHPEKYTIQKKEFTLSGPVNKNLVTDEFVEKLVKQQGIEDRVKRHNVRKDELRISCATHDLDIDLKSGQGEVTEFVSTPFISHIMTLHKSNKSFWVWYSDIFGVSLMIISITGVMMLPPKNVRSRRRAWILIASGVVVPILFLLLGGSL